jgi:hypothetical protein
LVAVKRTLLGALVALASCTADLAAAQPLGDETIVLARFEAAVNDYARLHRQLEQHLEPIPVSGDPETIQRLIDMMAAAVRAARPDARAGDLFTAGVSGVLRQRIHKALVTHGIPIEYLRQAANEDSAGQRVPLSINGRFPWSAATATPACVLDTLPELPPELEYRIVGENLVLLDVHASLIVDVLPRVLDGEVTR